MNKRIWLALSTSACAAFLALLTAPARSAAQEPQTATSTPSITPVLATPTLSPGPVGIVVTATPNPSPTATSQPAPSPDEFEPNNALDQAAPIEIGGSLQKLNFWPAGDIDYFAILLKPSQVGLTLTLQTRADYGIDTNLRLLWPDGREIAHNDDASPIEKWSWLEVRLHEPGYYIVEVSNLSIAAPDFKLYEVTTELLDPSVPAADSTPTSSPQAAWDAYENNYDFDHAPLISIGEDIKGLNFACPLGVPPDCGDNDFFQVQLKGGLCYTAETKDLNPALDTNLIVYGPERDRQPPLAGNDDAAPGELRSKAQFCIPPVYGSLTGYILVGNAGNRTPPAPVAERTYTLRVSIHAPPTPVATATATALAQQTDPSLTPAPPHTSGRGQPAGAPEPAGQAAPVGPTSAPPLPIHLPGITVEELPRRAAPNPSPRALLAVPLSIRACYDRNENRFCDVDEGIAGLTVYVTNGAGRIIAQSITDAQGVAAVTVRAEETEQLSISVPYFAARQTAAARSPRLKDILVSAEAPLPALLP